MIKTVNFAPGDIVRVFEKLKDLALVDGKEVKGGKNRIQVFEGVVIRLNGREDGKSFSVRKVVDGVGVEKSWPSMSPNVEKVVVKEHPKNRIRRAKLYYLRKQTN